MHFSIHFSYFHISNSSPYFIGTTKSITIQYKIENFGETAYLAQINITISESVNFMKTPSNCELENRQLFCDINNGSPLKNGELGFLNILLDTKTLDGTEVLVKANVISTGDERDDTDNHANDVIPFIEYSEVEISG